VSSTGLTGVSSQVLGDLAHLSDRLTGLTGQSKAEADALVSEVVSMHSSRRSCIGLGGACMCARGALCVFLSFGLMVCALYLSMFCLGCVEPLPLPKGSETCPLQVILLFAFFGFRSLVGVSLSRFFSFHCVFDYQNECVVNALIKWEIESHLWFEDRWMVASWSDE
jgi:hypothetical protein